MAFMMPVVKKNYALYGKQQRRTASEPDGARIPAQNPGAHGGHPRRRVKSEGPSLSTSPAAAMSGVEAMNAAMQHRSKPIGMRRVRGSAPILAPPASLPTCVHGPSTAPTGTSPAPQFTTNISSPSRSTSSSSTSSGSTSNIGRFHTKLVARLRRSLRLKDPEPTTS